MKMDYRMKQFATVMAFATGDKIKVKYYSSSSGDGEVEITLQEDK